MELNNTLSIRVFHKLETNDRRNHYIAKPHPTPKYLPLLHNPPSPYLYTILPPPPPTLNTILSPLSPTPLLPPLPSTPPTSPLPSTPPPPPRYTNTNPISHGTQYLSSTQAPHTLIITGHTLAIILPTLPHLSLNVAGTSAIETLRDPPTRPTAVTQGSHHQLAILKKFNTYIIKI